MYGNANDRRQMTMLQDDAWEEVSRLTCDWCDRELTMNEIDTMTANDGTPHTTWLCEPDKGGCGGTGWL